MEEQWGDGRPAGLVDGAEVDWDQVEGLIESRCRADADLMEAEDRAREKILSTVTLLPGFAAHLRAFAEQRSGEAGARALIDSLIQAEVRPRVWTRKTPNRRGWTVKSNDILLDVTGQVRGWLRGRARELREELGGTSRGGRSVKALLGDRWQWVRRGSGLGRG